MWVRTACAVALGFAYWVCVMAAHHLPISAHPLPTTQGDALLCLAFLAAFVAGALMAPEET